MNLPSPCQAEWLETDGLGGFAMGTASGVRTRRYHGLLVSALTPPSGRVVLVSGFDAWIETVAGRFALTTQSYRGEVRHPDGESRLESFDWEPWPTWRWRLPDGTLVEQELFIPHGASAVCLGWKFRGQALQNFEVSGMALATGGSADRPAAGAVPLTIPNCLTPARLIVRPLLAARDYHSLQHENSHMRPETDVTSIIEVTSAGRREESRVAWRPYDGLPAIVSWSNGGYQHAPVWYRQFLYSQESARGLDCLEDLASPGELSWDLSNGDAVWLLAPETYEAAVGPACNQPLTATVLALRETEAERRRQFPTWMHRSADQFIVGRGCGKTIIAGYPWFTDWGRDTFIAMRGLCLATGRLDVAESILLAWADSVSEGMLPNRFPDQGESLEFNSVDASLWFVIAVHEFLAASGTAVAAGIPQRPVASAMPLTNINRASATAATLGNAVLEILEGYARGTRFGIRLDADGLIAAGQPGVQLTWMDAKIGDWVVTPRIGKPVEIQALWLNALWLELQFAEQTGDAESVTRWAPTFQLGLQSFRQKFWNAGDGCLFDVIDVDHQPGAVDRSFRANQIFAAGGLPMTLLSPDRARQVVAAVESRLWTPLGLRTLATGSPNYAGHYGGSTRQRDAAYHQGTAWPWLLGPFIEAWVKSRQTDRSPSPCGSDDATIVANSPSHKGLGCKNNDLGDKNSENEKVKREALRRLVEPLLAHRYQAGLNHIAEIADGDAPHAPGGCPFQAWSLGELLRICAWLKDNQAEN